MTEPDAVGTSVERVTLFEDRAEVLRVARVHVSASVTRALLSGITPFVDDRSVEVVVRSGPARVLSSHVKRSAHPEEGVPGRDEIEQLERESRAFDLAVAEGERALARARASAEREAALFAQWAAGVSSSPRGLAGQPVTDGGSDGVASRWASAYEALDAAVERSLSARAEAERSLDEARRRAARAKERLQAGASSSPRWEATIEVQLEGSADGVVELAVRYRTPCALWRPEHQARLDVAEDGTTGTMTITSVATVWQRTGERWVDVPCTFSTARPARAGSPPLLADDVVASRRKTDAERSRVTVAAREQAVVTAGLDRGERQVAEMPGVDDGGEPLSFQAKAPVTIPSDGRPVRAELGTVTLACDVARVVFAERSPVAHVRATATLAAPYPLLAGPVRVARGGAVVGRATLGFVARGEPFELGFGPDDGVRVRRVVTEERDTTAIVGTQRLRRTVRLYLGSLSDEPRVVRVTERVPVSEIDDVTIQVLDAGGFAFGGRDGIGHRDVRLAPRATERLALELELRAGARVVLPF